MPILRREYGAIKNLRYKSGARFPPSAIGKFNSIINRFSNEILLNHKSQIS